MGFLDSLRDMQQEEDRKVQAAKEARHSQMPEEVAEEIAIVYFKHILEHISYLVKKNDFKYYNGIFGRKTECRYEYEYIFGPNSAYYSDIENEYYKSFEDGNWGGKRVYWDLDNAMRVIKYLDKLVIGEGMRTVTKKVYRKPSPSSYDQPHYEIIYTVTLPCDSNGKV